MSADTSEVQLVPVKAIRVINPRERDPKKFGQIVQNIETIGLKRPITVMYRADAKDNEESFDLVCGQGRLEAFVALGQTHIPALVRGFNRHDGLLASLVENLARRRVKAIDQIQAIKWMQDQGHHPNEIGRKTGLDESYVRAILVLLNKGEERLLQAALHERIPITIAVRIAQVSDKDVQRILMEAYEKKEVTQRSLSTFHRLIQQRKCYGREFGYPKDRVGRKRKTSVEGFVASYRAQAERQRILIKKARACEARLLSIGAVFKVLIEDEDFITTLRAEKLETMPRCLAERMKEES